MLTFIACELVCHGPARIFASAARNGVATQAVAKEAHLKKQLPSAATYTLILVIPVGITFEEMHIFNRARFLHGHTVTMRRPSTSSSSRKDT
jgi:hypothetical protein